MDRRGSRRGGEECVLGGFAAEPRPLRPPAGSACEDLAPLGLVTRLSDGQLGGGCSPPNHTQGHRNQCGQGREHQQGQAHEQWGRQIGGGPCPRGPIRAPRAPGPGQAFTTLSSDEEL